MYRGRHYLGLLIIVTCCAQLASASSLHLRLLSRADMARSANQITADKASPAQLAWGTEHGHYGQDFQRLLTAQLERDVDTSEIICRSATDGCEFTGVLPHSFELCFVQVETPTKVARVGRWVTLDSTRRRPRSDSASWVANWAAACSDVRDRRWNELTQLAALTR